MIHFGCQRVDGEVDFALLFAFRWPELRLKGQDSLAALLVLRGDVHDEGGTNVGIGNGIENLEGAVGFAFDGQLLKSCEKAALIAQRRGVVVVGVTRLPVGKNNGFGAELADNGGESQLVLSDWLHV